MGEDGQRRVADEQRYALDQAGIRRLLAAGDPLPSGWTLEQPEPEPEPEPPKKPSKRAVPRRKP